MRRTSFLGAGAAAFLTGCGGQHTLSALPGVAPFKGSSAPNLSSLRLVPDVADAIPATVLANPIVGEARRFDGAVAPSGWMLCQGQTLKVSDSRALFAILGSIAGGDGKTTFKLPNGRNLIIATGGVFPNSPALFTQSVRHVTAANSLGEGARPAMPSIPPPPSKETLAERRLAQQAIRVTPSAPVPLSHEMAGRIQQAHDEARNEAIAALSTGNQSRLANAVDDAVAGRLRVFDAVREMASALTDTEAASLLVINDAMTSPFRAGYVAEAHVAPRLEAAYFLLSVAFTPEQEQALGERERISGQ